MAQPLYHPFNTFNFNNQTCFLSGDKLQSPDEQITVFPVWFMQQFNLKDSPFKLLDESITTYPDLKLPCSASVYQSLEPLEDEIKAAFLQGYDAVKNIPGQKLFQWIGKLVYGIFFNEVQTGIRQQKAVSEQFTLSQSLAHKFSNLHVMLQSLIRPVVFEGLLPWTIKVFKVENAANTFSYRDEINTLVFSLRAVDFGIIACLQDNGANALNHKIIWDKMEGQPLHPIQFEEVCALFFYSAYRFNRLPEYTILPTEDAVFIEPMPLRGISNKPLFDAWETKTYSKVLENFWKKWGFSLFEIIKNPESPMSFLFDDDKNFKPSKSINLPA